MFSRLSLSSQHRHRQHADLGPLHLELLGLVIDLSRVVLTIRADSNGGLLGRLFCGIAGRSSVSGAELSKTAKKMTKAAQANGLNQGVAGFQAQVTPGFTQAPGTVCSILDLTLGPLDLNVLGLLVHLRPAPPHDHGRARWRDSG